MITNLIDNVKRLYILQNQLFHIQSRDGNAYYPEPCALTDADLTKSFNGEATLALNLISEDSLARTMVIDFDGVEHSEGQVHWEALKHLYHVLTQELGFCIPAISLSGRKGYGLWISLVEPIPTIQVQSFLKILKTVYLGQVEHIDLRPNCTGPSKAGEAVIKLPPCLHRANQKWSAFISLEEGGRYSNAPWLEQKPSFEQQNQLLAKIESTPISVFLKAFEKLRLKAKGLSNYAHQEDEKKHSPNFNKAPNEQFIAPCIQALLDNGVPLGMDYHQANLNLANYCHSANISKEHGRALAKKISEQTSTEDRTKSEPQRIKHFNSVHPKDFYCDYPRGIETWRKAFGGIEACNSCPINSNSVKNGTKQETKTIEASNYSEDIAIPEALMLKEEVALDLIKYAWDNRVDISHIETIWPLVEIPYQFNFKVNSKENSPKSRNLTLDWFKLAGKISSQDNNNAGFLRQTNKYIHNHLSYSYVKSQYKDESNKFLIETENNSSKIYFIGDSPHKLALNYRQKFFDAIQARTVNKQHGESTLNYAEDLEAKAKLFNQVKSSVLNPHNTISEVFAKTGKTLNEIIQRQEQKTPFGNQAAQLFQEIFANRQCVKTPFEHFNYLLDGGFAKGSLYVLLAPPKAGKTTLAACFMDFAAANGHPTLYMGYEMGKAQMVLYGLARKTGISSSKIQAVNLNGEEQNKILTAFKAYTENEGRLLTITEANSQYTLANAIAWIAFNKGLYTDKIPFVVIDYLQIAFSGIKEIDNQASASERVSQLAVMCKQIARKQGAALLVLSAVTKVGENDSTSKGIIDVTAARDSLAIIHAADGVLSLQSSTVSTKPKQNQGSMQIKEPWEILECFYREQGNESEADRISKGIRSQDEHYPHSKASANVRAVLYLLRHRGGTGEIPLYYRKALHQFEEVPLSQTHKTYYIKKDPTELLKKAHEFFGTEKSKLSMEILESSDIQPKDNVVTKSPELLGLEEPIEPKPISQNINYNYIIELQEAIGAIKILSGTVALDLETTGLDPLTAQIRLISLHDGENTLVIDAFAINGAHKLKSELETLALVGHNSVFDMQFLKQANILVTMDCTMIGHHLLTGEQKSLADLSQLYLEKVLDKKQQESDWAQPTLSTEQKVYAALDVITTLEIWNRIKIELKESNSETVYKLSRDAQPAITQMLLTGISFNVEKQRELIDQLENTRRKLKQKLDNSLNGKSHTSTKQMSEWLSEHLGGIDSKQCKKWPKTKSGQLKTGAEELRKYSSLLKEEAKTLVTQALIPIKDIDKQLSAFGNSLAEKIHPLTRRIHAKFNLTGAITGRMSCSNPNLQQMPREKAFRRLFQASDGYVFVIADYSQIELRVAAELAQESNMLKAFKAGKDIHSETAALISGQAVENISKELRQAAKAVSFGMLFGMGANGLQSYAENNYGVLLTKQQAEEYIDKWFKAYPKFLDWHKIIKMKSGKLLMVNTPMGRKRKWASLYEYKPTEALNTPVQGGAAEVMLSALAKVHNQLQGLNAKLIAVVHDELIVECEVSIAEQVLAIIKEQMTQGMLSVFPKAATNGLVDAKIAENWGMK